MIALACSDAPAGHDHWTLRLLAGKVVELSELTPLSRPARIPGSFAGEASGPAGARLMALDVEALATTLDLIQTAISELPPAEESADSRQFSESCNLPNGQPQLA